MKNTLLQLATSMNDYFNEYVCMFLFFLLIFMFIEFLYKKICQFCKWVYKRVRPDNSVKIVTVNPKLRIIAPVNKKAIGDP